jgi:hypothetical protein
MIDLKFKKPEKNSLCSEYKDKNGSSKQRKSEERAQYLESSKRKLSTWMFIPNDKIPKTKAKVFQHTKLKEFILVHLNYKNIKGSLLVEGIYSQMEIRIYTKNERHRKWLTCE